mmetsp:Transcript_4086/g.8912  ORF Transcript_4086/g.8912 Transcript_4086/m.8912 type:complete len:128 (-) Transcript_4086:60-443(-)
MAANNLEPSFALPEDDGPSMPTYEELQRMNNELRQQLLMAQQQAAQAHQVAEDVVQAAVTLLREKGRWAINSTNRAVLRHAQQVSGLPQQSATLPQDQKAAVRTIVRWCNLQMQPAQGDALLREAAA